MGSTPTLTAGEDELTGIALALKAAGNTRSELVLYPDAPHAFHADYRPTFRAEPARDGWNRALAWFARHGVA